ncbi:MAG: hypothetical protein M3083_13230 [Actinomycetota bacterium]|nr:hypothetical protein [Actinomycetota bacterium]MDQ6948156.1 hypothetical protein [Actinomycetota bacterium]
MAKLALDRRKSVVFGTSVVAAVLALSSVAYACVQSRGKITVTGDNGGVSTAVGNGHHPGAGPGNYIYCKPGKYLTADATSFADTATQNRGHFTVELGLPPTDCQFLQKNAKSPWITNTTTPNKFVDGTYEVYFCQGQDGQPAFAAGSPPMALQTKGSCFYSDGVTDYGTLVGTMSVVGNVAPPATFRVPFGAYPTPAGTYAGVSVRRTGPGSCMCGPPPINMAPIAMI